MKIEFNINNIKDKVFYRHHWYILMSEKGKYEKLSDWRFEISRTFNLLKSNAWAILLLLFSIFISMYPEKIKMNGSSSMWQCVAEGDRKFDNIPDNKNFLKLFVIEIV